MDPQLLAEKLATQRRLARQLGPYKGRWVAVAGDQVISDARSLESLRERLQELEQPPIDRCFQVLSGKRLILSHAA